MTSYSTLIETMRIGPYLAPFSSYSAFSAKVADFNPLHLHLSPLYGVIQFEFRPDLWRQKTTVPGRNYLRHPTAEHILLLLFHHIVCLAVLIECDIQTHRQTHDDDIYRASIASRGKNYAVKR